MNRRNFFKYTASGIVLPSIVTSLNADELSVVKNKYFPLDAIYKQSTPLDPSEDIILDKNYEKTFYSVRKKIALVQRYVGYGNFNIISFDDTIKIAKIAKSIEAFSKEEKDFLEFIFYHDPIEQGFYGEKISLSITDRINKKEVKKIPRTGHYLFKGKSEGIYEEMKKDIGNTLVLTSGVRSVMKQTKLFLDKLYHSKNNLSVTSRSIAPPAYTYHSIGDFDVGKKGLGYSNFTARFALTEEFLKMRKLRYIEMRYTINNKDGVRYEPWHVKII